MLVTDQSQRDIVVFIPPTLLQRSHRNAVYVTLTNGILYRIVGCKIRRESARSRALFEHYHHLTLSRLEVDAYAEQAPPARMSDLDF